MNFENASLNKYYQENNKDQTKVKSNSNLKDFQEEESKSKVKTLVEKFEKGTQNDNDEEKKRKEVEKKLKITYQEYLEKLSLLEDRENELNLLRKNEVKMQTELELLEENIEITKRKINVTIDPDPNLTEDLKNEKLEKEKILLEHLEELKKNKRMFDETIDIQKSDKKNQELELLVNRLFNENRELENKLKLIKTSVDEKTNDDYNRFFTNDLKLQIENMCEIKTGLFNKELEYNDKLQTNYSEISLLKNSIDELEETLYNEINLCETENFDQKSFKKEMNKIKNFIELIKNEVDYSKDPQELIKKINKNEKNISNFIQDKAEEEAENDILLSRNYLIKSLDQTSKNSNLPLIGSHSFSVKNQNKKTDDMNPSCFSEKVIDRINSIDLDSFSYRSTNHVEYSSLCKDETYLKRVNKDLLKQIEGLDNKYERQFENIIKSISYLKENLSFLKKENEEISAEIYELTNILNNNKSDEKNNPIIKQYNKFTQNNSPLEQNKVGAYKEIKKKRQSKNMKLLYQSREKFLKDVKFQRIKENKIF